MPVLRRWLSLPIDVGGERRRSWALRTGTLSSKLCTTTSRMSPVKSVLKRTSRRGTWKKSQLLGRCASGCRVGRSPCRWCRSHPTLHNTAQKKGESKLETSTWETTKQPTDCGGHTLQVSRAYESGRPTTHIAICPRLPEPGVLGKIRTSTLHCIAQEVLENTVSQLRGRR